MKNWIIAILAITCTFLLAKTLGVFRYGSGIDRNHYQAFEKKREKSVNQAPVWLFAAAYSTDNLPACEAIAGIETAMELVNRRGGICGKPVDLRKRIISDAMADYQQALQTFCLDDQVSVVLGPYHSGYIPAARAISQLQSLPLISPLTVVSEKLPKLEPDNFVSFFPPLTLWAPAVLDDMTRRGFRQLIIISPEIGSYGDIFCTAVERLAQQNVSLDHIYRINYQSPFPRREIERQLPDIQSINLPTALFFGGTFDEMKDFDLLLQDYSEKIAVYGTDDLFIPQIMKFDCADQLLLPRLNLQCDADFEALFRTKYGEAPSYQHILGAKTVFAVAEALEADGGYHVQSFIQSVRQKSEIELTEYRKVFPITMKTVQDLKNENPD